MATTAYCWATREEIASDVEPVPGPTTRALRGDRRRSRLLDRGRTGRGRSGNRHLLQQCGPHRPRGTSRAVPQDPRLHLGAEVGQGRRSRPAGLRDTHRPHRDDDLHGRLLPGDGARPGAGGRGRDLLPDQLALGEEPLAELDGARRRERRLLHRRQPVWAGTRGAVLRGVGGDRSGRVLAERPRYRRRHRLGMDRSRPRPRQAPPPRPPRRSHRRPPAGRLRHDDAQYLPLGSGGVPRVVRHPPLAGSAALAGGRRPVLPESRRRRRQSRSHRARDGSAGGDRSRRLPRARRHRCCRRSRDGRATGGEHPRSEHRAAARDRRLGGARIWSPG